MEQLIGTIDAMEETEIISANKLAEDVLSTRRKFLESTQSVVEKKYASAHEKMARDMEAAEEKLAHEKHCSKTVPVGSFQKIVPSSSKRRILDIFAGYTTFQKSCATRKSFWMTLPKGWKKLPTFRKVMPGILPITSTMN
jgi:hypothetical protein